MERHFGTGKVGLQRPRVSAVSDKAKLIALLVALAVINLEIEHFRGYGLSGLEMLIGACTITAAIVAYGFVHLYWDARESRKCVEEKKGRQDQS